MSASQSRLRTSVTLHEAVYAALPPGARVFAERGWAQRHVTWAHALEGRTFSLGSIEVGELVIVSTSVSALLGRERGLPGLLRGIAEREASACALYLEPSDEMLAAAREAHLPLVLLPSNSPPSEVERNVLELLTGREQYLRKRVDAVLERLLGTLVEEDGATAAAREVGLATGKHVFVFDQYFRLLGLGDEEDPSGVETLRERVAAAAQPGRGASDWAHSLTSLASPPGAAVLIRGLELRGAPAGWLCLVGGRDEFGELDHAVADRAASVLAIEVAKQRAVAEALFRLQGDFLGDLLGGPARELPSVAARARSMGYDLDLPHGVFAMQTAPRETGSAAARVRERFVEEARQEVLGTAPRALIRGGDGRVDVLLALSGPSADVAATVERLRESLSAACEGVPVAAGLGRVAQGIEAIRFSYQQASMALTIARDMYGGRACLRFEDLGVERLLIHLAGNPELAAFRDDMIGRLEAYDARHGAELTRTVEVFLATHGNLASAARTLNLHRNTLLYRLERSTELLGKDLDDPETRLAVQLALKIRTLAGSTDTGLPNRHTTGDARTAERSKHSARPRRSA